jgi:hypothetical protein
MRSYSRRMSSRTPRMQPANDFNSAIAASRLTAEPRSAGIWLNRQAIDHTQGRPGGVA